jgi:hypothetical protein
MRTIPTKDNLTVCFVASVCHESRLSPAQGLAQGRRRPGRQGIATLPSGAAEAALTFSSGFGVTRQ